LFEDDESESFPKPAVKSANLPTKQKAEVKKGLFDDD